jgi:hypothetical protein
MSGTCVRSVAKNSLRKIVILREGCVNSTGFSSVSVSACLYKSITEWVRVRVRVPVQVSAKLRKTPP